MFMGGSPARPCFSKPAPWAVAKRLRGALFSCERCGDKFKPARLSRRFCSNECRTQPKCPADFEATFVDIGRLACEERYRAAETTITRWLNECGKDRLTSLRAEHVRNRRGEAKIEKHPATIQDFRFVDPVIAKAAAHYLRVKQNGGWMISMAKDGDWHVGITRKSSAQLVDLAMRYGFDAATLKGESDVG